MENEFHYWIFSISEWISISAVIVPIICSLIAWDIAKRFVKPTELKELEKHIRRANTFFDPNLIHKVGCKPDKAMQHCLEFGQEAYTLYKDISKALDDYLNTTDDKKVHKCCKTICPAIINVMNNCNKFITPVFVNDNGYEQVNMEFNIKNVFPEEWEQFNESYNRFKKIVQKRRYI